MITRMTRHWISFKIHGITPLTSLRIPIPWTKLSQVDQYEHMTRYASLSPIPLPPPSIHVQEGDHGSRTRGDRVHGSGDRDGVTSPYDYEVTASDSYLRRQLALRDANRSENDSMGYAGNT